MLESPSPNLFQLPVYFPSEQDDAALVKRTLAGDQGAFEGLVQRYQKVLYTVALRMLGNPDDAKDATQTAFVRAFERLASFDEQYKFFSWIYRIALNDSLNLLRDRGRETPLEDGYDPPGPESASPERQAEDSQTSQRVQEALMKMKVTDRAVLALRHFSDCSYEEIAEIMRIDVRR